MADAKPQGEGSQDPSMEEILQSIRRIIAEDEKDDAKPASAPASARGGDRTPSLSSDVLELTEMIEPGEEEDALVLRGPEEKPRINTETVLSAPTQGPEFGGSDLSLSAPPVDVLASIDTVLNTPAPLPPLPPSALMPETPEPEINAGGSDLGGARSELKIPASDLQTGAAKEMQIPGSDLLSEQAATAASAALKKIVPQMAAQVSVATTPFPPTRPGTTVEDLLIEMLRPMLKSWLDTNLPGIVERIVEREVKKLSSGL